MDNLTKKQRTKCMSHIKSKNTKIEILFRKYIWSKKLRGYRKNTKLIGKPDIVFNKKKIIVFIDGCFWHKCPKCYKEPRSNKNYWNSKIAGNVARDNKINKILKNDRWCVIRFWEHEITNNIKSCYEKLRKKYNQQ